LPSEVCSTIGIAGGWKTWVTDTLSEAIDIRTTVNLSAPVASAFVRNKRLNHSPLFGAQLVTPHGNLPSGRLDHIDS
jgi:hypothetical protein